MPAQRHRRAVSEVADFGFPCVLKTTRGGYDGKGVWFVSGPEDCAEAFVSAAATETRILAEELVDYRRELSALVARSPSGQVAAWPVVASTQRDGICREVIAPAPDLDRDLAVQAQQIAMRIAGELDVTGVLAVELFETNDGRVLVNELAMRPHNTGHWTQDGSVTTQFENHLRAVLDLPLGAPDAREPVDGDGEHPRRPRSRPATSTTATRTRWPGTRACGCTSTARNCARGARSATSTPTARTSRIASSEPVTQQHGSPESWESERVSMSARPRSAS